VGDPLVLLVLLVLLALVSSAVPNSHEDETSAVVLMLVKMMTLPL
jgi:hypothetical protein